MFITWVDMGWRGRRGNQSVILIIARVFKSGNRSISAAQSRLISAQVGNEGTYRYREEIAPESLTNYIPSPVGLSRDSISNYKSAIDPSQKDTLFLLSWDSHHLPLTTRPPSLLTNIWSDIHLYSGIGSLFEGRWRSLFFLNQTLLKKPNFLIVSYKKILECQTIINHLPNHGITNLWL